MCAADTLQNRATRKVLAEDSKMSLRSLRRYLWEPLLRGAGEFQLRTNHTLTHTRTRDLPRLQLVRHQLRVPQLCTRRPFTSVEAGSLGVGCGS